MTFETWIDERIALLTPDDLVSYLQKHGWKQREQNHPLRLWFEGPLDDHGEPFLQLVPAVSHVADYRRRVEELVTVLGKLEDRHPTKVLDEMLENQSRSGNNGPPQNAEQLVVTDEE